MKYSEQNPKGQELKLNMDFTKKLLLLLFHLIDWNKSS